MHCNFKIWHLVGTILIIFAENLLTKLAHLVQFTRVLSAVLFEGLGKQLCRVSNILCKSHAFSVTLGFSACLGFISRISCFCLLLNFVRRGQNIIFISCNFGAWNAQKMLWRPVLFPLHCLESLIAAFLRPLDIGKKNKKEKKKKEKGKKEKQEKGEKKEKIMKKGRGIDNRSHTFWFLDFGRYGVEGRARATENASTKNASTICTVLWFYNET